MKSLANPFSSGHRRKPSEAATSAPTAVEPAAATNAAPLRPKLRRARATGNNRNLLSIAGQRNSTLLGSGLEP